MIPTLNPDKKHLLWLDYDDILQDYMVSHMVDALTILSPGSIIVLTIDVDSKSLDDNKAWFNHLTDEVSDYLPSGLSSQDCGSKELTTTILAVLHNMITHTMSSRAELDFKLLFNFLYADGHTMLTIGGVLAGREDRRILRSCEWDRFPFCRRNFDQAPFTIKVPNFTRRERFYLDSHMPRIADWIPKAFQIEEEDLSAYSKIFGYCPLYGELLL
ncbi:MAG TPA: hypothetical protein PK587_11600 [Syntrophales bacterium]|nr:hypothetical protein [Syntrophales bacterium]